MEDFSRDTGRKAGAAGLSSPLVRERVSSPWSQVCKWGVQARDERTPLSPDSCAARASIQLSGLLFASLKAFPDPPSGSGMRCAPN